MAFHAAAVPARPGTFTVTQRDGTVLTLQMVGDEYFHYFLDVNSGRRMQRDANGDYTIMPETEFVRLRAAAQQRASMANTRRLERMAKYQQAASIATTPALTVQSGPQKTIGNFNGSLTGQRKGLVILVNFADLAHSLDNPQKTWGDAFNLEGYSKNKHVGSVHDYFYDQSYGKFDLEFDVVGPVTVSRNMKYYGQNNSYNSDSHPAEMVAEACTLIDDLVDFSDYDWDGDGEVDQVYVIYAGYGESSGAPSETIWPHEYWLEYEIGHKLNLDGTDINTYACSCELRGSGGGVKTMTGIGTACHEFSHCIGFPDFYDVKYNGGFGMDVLDVLGAGSYNGPSSNGEVPQGYSSYERWMAGWLEPVELTEGCDIDNMPSLADEPVAYILRNKNKGTAKKPVDEYFLLENRQNTKWFTYPLNAHGMLVLHVDFDSSDWSWNQVNTTPSHQRMGIVPAGKTLGSYNSTYKQYFPTSAEYRSMFFPGANNVTSWTDDSHYECGGKLFNRNKNGTYTLGMPITQIKEDAATGNLSFVCMGGKDLGYRWKVSYETGNEANAIAPWQQSQNGETVVLPDVVPVSVGWRFFGWTTSPVVNSSVRPETLYTPGTVIKPLSDMTLYAVYGVGADGPLREEYKLTESIVDGQKYLLLSKKAPSETDIVGVDASVLTLGSASKSNVGAVVNVDFTGETPICIEPQQSIIWTAKCNGDLISFVDNAGNYLNISSAGLGLYDTPNYVYWDKNYGLYGKAPNGSSYYIHTSSGKFTVSATRQASSRVYLYVQSDYSDKDVVYTTYLSPLDGVRGIHAGADRSALPTFDLQGRRVASPASSAPRSGKGVYVQGGRKVLR